MTDLKDWITFAMQLCDKTPFGKNIENGDIKAKEKLINIISRKFPEVSLEDITYFIAGYTNLPYEND